MTQSALSRLEADGVIPTIPLPERIPSALDAGLIVQISPHAARPAHTAWDSGSPVHPAARICR
jgi:hypothetical protein